MGPFHIAAGNLVFVSNLGAGAEFCCRNRDFFTIVVIVLSAALRHRGERLRWVDTGEGAVLRKRGDEWWTD